MLTHSFYFHLEFEGTNNVAIYESILLGLDLAKEYGIKFLDIVGNSNPIVMQVKRKFVCENQRLKRYRDAVRLATKSFYTLFLQVVPREQNQLTNFLVASASALYPTKAIIESIIVKVIYRPSVLDNFEDWQILDDDEQMLGFMEELFQPHRAAILIVLRIVWGKHILGDRYIINFYLRIGSCMYRKIL